jgi:hypothetical protein
MCGNGQKVSEMANALMKKAKLEEDKQSTLSLEPKVIKCFSQDVDYIVYACM